jgi:hypothetical protein
MQGEAERVLRFRPRIERRPAKALQLSSAGRPSASLLRSQLKASTFDSPEQPCGAKVKDLPDDVHERVKILCAAGDQLAAQESYVDAIAKYEEAFAQLPEPRTDWDAATWIKAALADAHFFSGDYQACWNATQDAVKCCPGALENAFLHPSRRPSGVRARMDGGREPVAHDSLDGGR